ncbi:MAG: TRAP transporter substrate-binding protein [Candidatus Rokubacteria bacterium]|nr:TRAP transporter substrate-binding protein [Candidatus Rokubacteria bacterium]
MRRLMVGAMVVAAAVAGLPGGGAEAQGPRVLKLGHVLAVDHPYQEGAVKLAELVAAKTNNRIKIEVFPNAQLGGERDMVEGLQIGTVDLVLTAPGIAASVANERKVFLFDMPYIFKDYEAASRILESKIGAEMVKNYPKHGFRNIGWFIAGFHQVTNSKRPIRKPDDLKGLKMRMWQSKSAILAMESLGAKAVPMSFPEVYTSLQQGVIDGFANSLATIYATKMYEVQKYVSLTNHMLVTMNTLIAERVYRDLSPADRKAIDEAGVEAARYQRNLYKAADEKYLKLLRDKGVTVNSDVDVAAFRKQVDASYPKFVELVNEPGAKELATKIIRAGAE